MKITNRGWALIFGVSFAIGLLAPWDLLPWN
jgi:hypothetical protein